MYTLISVPILFVTGGFGWLEDTEVVPLGSAQRPTASQLTCSKPADNPANTKNHGMGLVGTMPLLCGGFRQACSTYHKGNDSWTEVAVNISITRTDFMGAQLSDTRFMVIGEH